MRIAVVGATGLVGGVIRKILSERDFPVTEFIPVASERSVGKRIDYNGREFPVVSMAQAISLRPDIALFSAGGSTSKKWAPEFAKAGTYVIDNSSAWRMDPSKKLIVPEINGDSITHEDKIIANPNCSTIQMVIALAPLHTKYGIKRLVISTYQSFTGTGMKAVRQYESERDGVDNKDDSAYPHQIFENCLPHCDVFFENGYTREELKLVNETRKILNDQNVQITATAVRVPVYGGHSESVNVELKSDFDIQEIKELLHRSKGVVVMDDVMNNVYPTPLYAKNKDEVFVGRIRRDDSLENALNLWIVSDNLRKGAGTNAVQIAEHLLKKGILKQREELVV